MEHSQFHIGQFPSPKKEYRLATEVERTAFFNCAHFNMHSDREGDEVVQWWCYYCPDCSFGYDQSMGSSLVEAMADWREYIHDTSLPLWVRIEQQEPQGTLQVIEVEAKTFISREAARQLIADILPHVEVDPYQPPVIVVYQVAAEYVFDAIMKACDPPMTGEEFNKIADEIEGSTKKDDE